MGLALHCGFVESVGSRQAQSGHFILSTADKSKVPVLLFHGGHDANVSIEQSKSMAARLKAVGGKCELVTWDDLEHQLDDSDARAGGAGRSARGLRW